MRNWAWPISSANTPPGPKATSGPKTGSCTIPASSSAPPRTIGWTMAGEPMRATRLAHLAFVREVEREQSLIGLVHSRLGRLDDDGIAELAGRRHGLFSALATTSSGTTGMPYAVSSPRTSAGSSHASVELSSARATSALAAGSSMPSSSGVLPAGARSQSARSTARPSARAADRGT